MPTSFNRSDLSNAALKAWQSAHPELAPASAEPRKVYHVNHSYDKETLAMTTPTPAEQFREEIREQFAAMREELEAMRADLSQIRDGLTQAAQPAARASSGQVKTFLAVSIVHSVDDNGKDSFKVRGGPYARNGVRIWPEVLPLLGLDAATLPHGVTTLETPINVLVEMHDYTDPDTKETRVTPYKIIGKA